MGSDRGERIPSGYVQYLEDPRRRPPPAYARRDDRVDVGGARHPGLDQRYGLPREGHLEPDRDEAGDLLLDDHGPVARALHQVHYRRDGRAGRVFAGHDLDEGHQVGRVDEVRHDHAVLPAGRRPELRGGKGRRAAGQYSLRAARLVEPPEEAAFQVYVLVHGFEDHARVVDRVLQSIDRVDVCGGNFASSLVTASMSTSIRRSESILSIARSRLASDRDASLT